MIVRNATETIDSLNIPFCPKKKEVLTLLAYGFSGLNAVSLLVNILHIIILSRIPTLKNTGYYHILVHISIADILFALTQISSFTLNEPSYFRNAPIALLVLYVSIKQVGRIGRFYIMTAASLERYLAVCHPMTYASSKYIVHLPKWLCLIWILTFITVLVRIGAGYQYLCFGNLTGPTIIHPLSSKVFTAFMCISSWCYCSATLYSDKNSRKNEKRE